MNKALNLLSLARKGGRIEVGEEPMCAAARAGHARLVVVAEDATDHTKRRAKSAVAGSGQQFITVPFTKDEIGAALGRTSVATAALTDPALALAFVKELEAPERYAAVIQDLEQRTRRVKKHRMEEKAHQFNVRHGKNGKKSHGGGIL